MSMIAPTDSSWPSLYLKGWSKILECTLLNHPASAADAQSQSHFPAFSGPLKNALKKIHIAGMDSLQN